MRVEGCILTPDGTAVKQKTSMKYFGSLLTNDGSIGAELNRRLGLARADFRKLQTVWSHANLSSRRKVRIFDACIATKLLYGLASACLTQAERRRLAGFHARCIRKIIGVVPSYYSRVPNSTVLLRARTCCLSRRLLREQCLLFGKIAKHPDTDPVRYAIFLPNTTDLRPSGAPRKVGRPRMQWSTSILKALQAIVPDPLKLQSLLGRAVKLSIFSEAIRKHFAV